MTTQQQRLDALRARLRARLDEFAARVAEERALVDRLDRKGGRQ
jgi:hypothetical protein